MSWFIKYLKNILKPTPSLFVSHDSGARHNKTIVLLHGIAATSKTWDVLINDLNKYDYRIVAIDLLGFGDSPKPVNSEYSIEDHVESIRKTIRKLRLHKPYTIVGHSMGAIIAASYSRRYSNEVDDLYLLSPPIYLDRNVSQTGISRKLTDVYLEAYRFLADKKDFTIKNSQFLRKLIRLKDGIDINEENWNGFRLSLINTIVNQNFYEDIKYSDCHIGIIYGALDKLLIQESINKLRDFHNVTITKLQTVNHIVGPRFAKEVVKQLLNNHFNSLPKD